MDESEIFKVGDKSYVNPQKEVDETNAFVDTLRNTASNEMQNIQDQTHALGSDLPSSHGGLSGSGGVWADQYQTPVTNTLVANLQATAQSDALNNAMSNYQTYLQDQYNQAYRNYAARERAKSSSSSSGNTSNTNNSSGNVTTESDQGSDVQSAYVQSNAPGTTTIVDIDGMKSVSDSETGETISTSGGNETKWENEDYINNYQWWNPFTWF